MDAEQRKHIETLLQTHQAVLRVLEQQQATLGIMTPPYVVTQIAEYRQKIADLEVQLRGAASSSKVAPRHNLPPRDYEQFVGRQTELAEVRRLLGRSNRAVAVTIDGIGGIGKSSLALESAYMFVDQYTELTLSERFEAIIWISAKRTYLTASGIRERRQVFHTVEDVFARIASVLDYPVINRVPAKEQRTIVEQALREQRTLLILDNLETIDDDELMDFLHELPDPTKALITTRHRIDVGRPIRLRDMVHGDALALINEESRRKDVMLQAEECDALWQRTGGMPLAIVWSIGLISLGGSVESVLKQLSNGQNAIVEFCFEKSVAQIRKRDAHTLLLALSLFASDASREALGIVADFGKDESGRDDGLAELIQLSLVNKENDRFSLLALTRTFACNEAKQFDEWMKGARERWQKYFYNLTITMGGWTHNWQGQDKVAGELANILAVIHSLDASIQYQKISESQQVIDPSSIPHAEMLVDLIDKVARTCRIRGYWNDCEKLSLTSLEFCRTLNNIQAAGWRYHDLARISYYRGDISGAKQAALEVLASGKQSRNQNIINRANLILGLIALKEGYVDHATTLLTTAFNEHQNLDKKSSLSNFTAGMGELEEHQGRLPSAATWYERSVALSRQYDHLSHLTSNLLNLGRINFALGNIAKAQDCYIESLSVAEECRRLDISAATLYQIALLEYHLGQQDSQIHASEALELFRRLGMKREQADAESLLAKLTQESQSS